MLTTKTRNVSWKELERQEMEADRSMVFGTIAAVFMITLVLGTGFGIDALVRSAPLVYEDGSKSERGAHNVFAEDLADCTRIHEGTPDCRRICVYEVSTDRYSVSQRTNARLTNEECAERFQMILIERGISNNPFQP